MIGRYWLTGLLVILVVVWFFLPKVTKNDSEAYAHALFLEFCSHHLLNPHQYQAPTFRAEGEKDLEYVYEFRSGNMPTIEIRIDRWGQNRITVLPRTEIIPQKQKPDPKPKNPAS